MVGSVQVKERGPSSCKRLEALSRQAHARALTKRGVDEDRVVQLLGCASDRERPHLGKDTERVALGQQLSREGGGGRSN